jgi:hypothetical protein
MAFDEDCRIIFGENQHNAAAGCRPHDFDSENALETDDGAGLLRAGGGI